MLASAESPLNLSYKTPDPTLTLAYGTLLPGGGWLHLSSQPNAKRSDAMIGMVFLAGTVVSAMAIANGAKYNTPTQVVGFSLLFGGIRLLDMTSSVKEALGRK